MYYYRRNSYMMASSSDSTYTLSLGFGLIALKYLDKLPLYASASLYSVLWRTSLCFGLNYICVNLAMLILGKMAAGAESLRSACLSSVPDASGGFERASYGIGAHIAERYLNLYDSTKLVEEKAVARSYLFYTVKSLVARSVEKYYLGESSMFMGVLAVVGVQFTIKMSHALLHREQYIDEQGVGYDQQTNFAYMVANSFRKALGSTAIRLCSVTIEDDQKHIISQIIVMPVLFCSELLAKMFVKLVWHNSKLVDTPVSDDEALLCLAIS